MGRVMIVDDEPDMRMALRLFLENNGHTVEEAENGEAALARLPESAFDLVLLDMRMPGLDGLQTLTKIRESNKDLPVIMVTGYGSVDSTAEVMAQGANGYIAKPFQHQELRDAMARAGLVSTPTGDGRPEAGETSGFWRLWVVKWSVALVSLSLVSCLFGYQRGWFTNEDFKLAYSNPVDMTWANGKLWVGDWFTQSIYIHDIQKSGAPIVKTYYLPDVHVTGVAVAGDRLFTADSWAKKINRHKLDEYLTLETSWPSPGPSPTSLFFDGKYLWSIDSKAARIYQHRLDDHLTIVGDYKAPGSAPVGFFKDDKYAWVSDSQSRRLYKLRLDDQLTPLAAYSLEEMEQRQEPLSCFRWIDGNLWFARDRLNQMYKRTPRSLLSMKLSKEEPSKKQ
jgi:CheY-like chemotaxis protein